MRHSKILFRLLPIALIIVSFIVHGCRKAESLPPSQEKMFDDVKHFFDTSNTTVQIQRVAIEFNKGKTSRLISSFVSKYGNPLWEKGFLLLPGQSNLAKGDLSISDTIVIIPVIQPADTQVKTYIEAHLSKTVKLFVRTASDYLKSKFSNSKNFANGAEKVAVRFMLLNKYVFDQNSFKILDKRLFHSSGNYSDTTGIVRFVAIKEKISNAKMVTVCVDIITTTTSYHCTHTGSCTSGICDLCYLCVSSSSSTRTMCESWWESDSGNSGSIDPTSGGGGGTGGGSDDPCSGGSITVARVAPTCNTDPGWEPNNGLQYTDPQEFYFYSEPAIDLEKLFKCFDNVSNNGATYKIKLCTDIPNNSNANHLVSVTIPPQPGHAFITLTKTNGSSSVTQSFGFYPTNGPKSLGMQSQDSKMNDNGAHEYDASIEMEISAAQFNSVKNNSHSLTSNKYDLNGFNCTDFALAVFNGVRQSLPIVVPDWSGAGTGYNYGTTPNGLYFNLKTRALGGDPSVQIQTNSAPARIGLCQ